MNWREGAKKGSDPTKKQVGASQSPGGDKGAQRHARFVDFGHLIKVWQAAVYNPELLANTAAVPEHFAGRKHGPGPPPSFLCQKAI